MRMVLGWVVKKSAWGGGLTSDPRSTGLRYGSRAAWWSAREPKHLLEVDSTMDPQRSARLTGQLEFLAAADLLKHVDRANRVGNGSRRENSAEHSWHVCLMAMVL